MRASDDAVCLRLQLQLSGVVQGVGMRPFVARLATDEGLAGHVRNRSGSVAIEIEGERAAIARFRQRLASELPPAARIDRIDVEQTELIGERGFRIETSATDTAAAPVLPTDLASCTACLAELRHPGDRRHRYPFTTCTDCGPRFTIAAGTPFDRERSSMVDFPLCERCAAEFADPHDRRCHAQIMACPDCGPMLRFADGEGRIQAQAGDALTAAVAVLRAGAIVAVKAVGGFHLMLRADDEAAVRRLRERKRRPRKPFALLLRDLDAVRELCRCCDAEAALLQSPAAPLMLLRRRARAASIADAVAPSQRELACMLAANPLQHLLCDALLLPLIATSGNRGGEPICIADDEALAQLRGIADAFLLHDRRILHPADDSIARVVDSGAQLLRRARGYVPAPITLPTPLPQPTIAVGGQLKSAPAFGVGDRALLAPHLGDLDSYATAERFEQAIADLQRQQGAEAQRVTADLHPDYASGIWAERSGLPLRRVQHHLAHLLACLADNGLSASTPVLGIVWDGTGAGIDGTIWGGEALLLRQGRVRRLARLRPFPLPGGEAAVREPWRLALTLLQIVHGDDADTIADALPALAVVPVQRRRQVLQLAASRASVPCGSMGRLLDGIAALCGLCSQSSYEGEAAGALEQVAGTVDPERSRYRLIVGDSEIVDWQPALMAIITDLRRHRDPAAVAADLHGALIALIRELALRADCRYLALSGGCFQSRLLAELAPPLLRADGRVVLQQRQVPPGDGGLALGQLLAAAHPITWER